MIQLNLKQAQEIIDAFKGDNELVLTVHFIKWQAQGGTLYIFNNALHLDNMHIILPEKEA